MNILVCVKQVPDQEGQFFQNAAGTWFDEDGHVWRMNEYDACAVEQAIRLREQLGGDTSVTVISIGPQRVTETIRKALAMGCDHGVHIEDTDASERDPWQIASMIARFAGSSGFDLIFTGMQSEDRSSAQVGVLAAGRIGLACVTGIITFEFQNGYMRVERELEAGRRCTLRLKAPALLTCQLGLNLPRYPSLPNIMKAKRAQLTVLQAEELCPDMPKTLSFAFRRCERKKGNLVLEGEAESIALQVVSLLGTQISLTARGGAQ